MRKKDIKKQKFNFDLKKAKVYVLGTVCGMLAIACIFMTIESATNGSEIASLERREAELIAKQQELQEELVQALSVNRLEAQSSALGFAKVTNLVYVTDSAPVAAKLP